MTHSGLRYSDICRMDCMMFATSQEARVSRISGRQGNLLSLISYLHVLSDNRTSHLKPRVNESSIVDILIAVRVKVPNDVVGPVRSKEAALRFVGVFGMGIICTL